MTSDEGQAAAAGRADPQVYASSEYPEPPQPNTSATPADGSGEAAGGSEEQAEHPSGPVSTESRPASGSADQQGGGGNKPRAKNRAPTILGELNLKVTPKGIVLPESYKTLRQRWRERRARDEAAGVIKPWQSPAGLADAGEDKKKRRAGKAKQSLGVVLDETNAALFHAAVSGDDATCQAAVAAGADVNVRTNADLDGIGTGGTALHVAAARGHVDVVAALLSAGANAAAATGRGELPVQLATRMGHVDVVKLLRHVGASPMDAEGALRLLKSAPAWDGKKKRRLMSAVLPPSTEGRWPQRGGAGKGQSKSAESALPLEGGPDAVGNGGDQEWDDRQYGDEGGSKGQGREGGAESASVVRSQYWLHGFEDGVSGEYADDPVRNDGQTEEHYPQSRGKGKGKKGFGRKGRKGHGKTGKGGKGKKGG